MKAKSCEGDVLGTKRVDATASDLSSIKSGRASDVLAKGREVELNRDAVEKQRLAETNLGERNNESVVVLEERVERREERRRTNLCSLRSNVPRKLPLETQVGKNNRRIMRSY